MLPNPQRALKEQEIDERHRAIAELRRQRTEQRLELRTQRKADRDEFYRERGIEPGPFACFSLLPDWIQVVGLGLCLGGTLIVMFLAFSKYVK